MWDPLLSVLHQQWWSVDVHWLVLGKQTLKLEMLLVKTQQVILECKELKESQNSQMHR